MKIVKASKYSDVVERQKQLRDRVAYQQSVYDEQSLEYNKAKVLKQNQVVNYIRGVIANATSDSFADSLDVVCHLSKYNAKDPEVSVEIKVQCESKDSPLRWDWYFEVGRFRKGVHRETGSWSGLNAVTSEDVSKLRVSIDALQALATLTDEDILYVATSGVPARSDYVTQQVDRLDEAAMLEEQIEALIGDDVYIKTSYGSYRTTVYFKILRQTAKQYEIEEYAVTPAGYYLDRDGNRVLHEAELVFRDRRRSSKGTVLANLTKPLVVLTQDEMDSEIEQMNKDFREQAQKEGN